MEIVSDGLTSMMMMTFVFCRQKPGKSCRGTGELKIRKSKSTCPKAGNRKLVPLSFSLFDFFFFFAADPPWLTWHWLDWQQRLNISWHLLERSSKEHCSSSSSSVTVLDNRVTTHGGPDRGDAGPMTPHEWVAILSLTTVMQRCMRMAARMRWRQVRLQTSKTVEISRVVRQKICIAQRTPPRSAGNTKARAKVTVENTGARGAHPGEPSTEVAGAHTYRPAYGGYHPTIQSPAPSVF
ncbi:hypothetical protein B0T17DRAFT_131126 [Bombardia bombarda]|uniref:Uncharacterized protein n=1 Tax=Bombardia bombarda TaxID=252184 RepID=A0AA39WA91_9PEZI|nr:hypothetical protein B0T17DRAFT_131126 [Bombardia bombarda]